MAEARIHDIRDSVDKQIAELQSQVASLTKRLSAQARNAADQASDVADDAQGRIRTAVATARQQGVNVADVARENPAAATSALLMAGLVGAAIGYLVGSAGHQDERRWRW